MNKKLIILGIIILIASIAIKLTLNAFKNFKPDDFKKASIIFVVDSSASNQSKLNDEIKFVKQLCKILDPEDVIKILKVSEDSYLIYEGSPLETSSISKSFDAFTEYDEKEYGTAYGEGLKKAFTHALNMKKEGYVPSIIVLGDLENEGAIEKQINWDVLPSNVKKVQEQIPEISMAFLYAHPEKLDFVKEKLLPILGENKLIIATEYAIDKVSRKILNAIGR
ncbi:MAG: VWA domain-containing protein [Cyanobacteria bacterium SIG30]|nr:VWA domain-containing protein [Cyanobacteria bacterium SIG30]